MTCRSTLTHSYDLVQTYSQNYVQIVLSESGEPLFYNQRDGPFMPTLKLLHKSAFCLSTYLYKFACRCAYD